MRRVYRGGYPSRLRERDNYKKYPTFIINNSYENEDFDLIEVLAEYGFKFQRYDSGVDIYSRQIGNNNERIHIHENEITINISNKSFITKVEAEPMLTTLNKEFITFFGKKHSYCTLFKQSR